jgi:hypothetical protein
MVQLPSSHATGAFDVEVPESGHRQKGLGNKGRFHTFLLRRNRSCLQVFDETITKKWMSEVMNNPDLDFTQKMADYCVEELKYKAQILKQTGFIGIYNGDVIKSDTAISAELQSSLKAAVASLENVPSRQKDWRPGSNEQVLDLVHPSLFPLVYGISCILKDDTIGLDDFIARYGEGEVIEKQNGYYDDHESNIDYIMRQSHPYSTRFQWLPCDIDISGVRPK